LAWHLLNVNQHLITGMQASNRPRSPDRKKVNFNNHGY